MSTILCHHPEKQKKREPTAKKSETSWKLFYLESTKMSVCCRYSVNSKWRVDAFYGDELNPIASSKSCSNVILLSTSIYFVKKLLV